jgi:Cys-tRNA(Pro)/Cys-tRNA(Cys) deacylase
MSKITRATQALEKASVAFTLQTYAYDPDADSIGLQAAAGLGAEPRRVLKTLMAEVDGRPVCVIAPSDREVSMKKLAAAFQGKSAKMMRPADAERLTGYHVGASARLDRRNACRPRSSRAHLQSAASSSMADSAACRSRSTPTMPSGCSVRPCLR